MNARSVVAILLGATVMLSVVGRTVLIALYPDLQPMKTENLAIWEDLLKITVGGLLVYIGVRGNGQ